MLIGSLCSGYGGLDMGVQAVLGGTVAFHADVDPAANAVLAHHYPDVPNVGDIWDADWEEITTMPAPRNDALAQTMYDAYCQGMSLEQVASAFGRSRQTVWKMFDRRGFDMRPVRGPARHTVVFNGGTFSLGDLGYLRRTSGDRTLLHRAVWEHHHGPIPPDHDVHHIDHNKLNNDLANLRLLTKADHTRLHAEEVVPTGSPAVDVLTAGYPRAVPAVLAGRLEEGHR